MAVTINGSGQVPVQVIQAVKTDTYSSTISTFTDIPSLSVSITPRNASNKILVIVDLKIANGSGYIVFANIVRNGTTIYVGDTSGSRTSSSTTAYSSGTNQNPTQTSIIYLDSPATTSAVTYKVQGKPEGNNPFYVNRGSSDGDLVYMARTASSITVMEISG
jgi:hypothetical protein